ncbi:MAG: PilZ domain-containing protein [Polyangiaceae bacterium]|nr:PilZ domain-containing protein [Polyangiaceae bacterium]
MPLTDDRRLAGVDRVHLTTLVDICALDSHDAAPFQAESKNISRRGMQVRTSFLPEIGETLVCRFEQEGREILVEGRVAWRSEASDSGEFGLQFTALEADGAEILAELSEKGRVVSSSPIEGSDPSLVSGLEGISSPGEEERDELVLGVGPEINPPRPHQNRKAQAAPSETTISGASEKELGEESPAKLVVSDHQPFDEGARVKLHIDSLGAPMKAAVQQDSERKLKVGSHLEFLKVGGRVEVEDAQNGELRGAHVDTVNVVLNPSTSIPELVVQLRYEGFQPTPLAPEVESASEQSPLDNWSEDVDELSFEGDQDDEAGVGDPLPPPSGDSVKEHLNSAWQRAGTVAGKASVLMTSWAGTAKDQAHVVFDQAGQRFQELQAKGGSSSSDEAPKPLRSQSGASRRRTSGKRSVRAPAHLRSGIHDLGMTEGRPSRRRVAPAQAPEAAAMPRGKKRLLMGAAAGATVLATSLLIRGWGESSSAPDEDLQAVIQETPSAQAETGGLTASARPLAPPTAVAAAGVSDAHPQKEFQGPNTESSEIIAEVPLFGAQKLAKLAPAEPAQGVSDAQAEKLAAAAAVQDQTWSAPSVSKVQPRKMTQWGVGRLTLPTVYRIRLDGAGEELTGIAEPTGFSVTIPGRRSMENGAAIQERDSRLVRVKTTNSSSGTKLRFEFRGVVPGYKVRLKNDFVEVFISAPDAGVARL